MSWAAQALGVSCTRGPRGYTARISWRAIAAGMAAGALMVAGVWLAGGEAHASPEDDATYLAVLHMDGITSGNGDRGLLITANQVCAAFAQGFTYEDVAVELARVNPQLGMENAGIVIGAATSSYCTQYPPAEPSAPNPLHHEVI